MFEGMENNERDLPRRRMPTLQCPTGKLDPGWATVLAALIGAAAVVAAAWIGLLGQVAVAAVEWL